MNVTPEALRVLVVEPHADTRDLYTFILGAQGWLVLAAHDAASAMGLFVEHAPTIVVSETWLPEGNEMALLARFAEAGAAVVALTTAPRHQRPVWDSLSLFAVLQKPCLPNELVAAVQRAAGPSATSNI